MNWMGLCRKYSWAVHVFEKPPFQAQRDVISLLTLIGTLKVTSDVPRSLGLARSFPYVLIRLGKY